MKYSLCIATIIIVILSQSSCKLLSEKQDIQIPDAGKISHEFLVQNTVKFAKANGIFQSDIDKYQILNGLSARDDPNTKRSTIYKNDNEAYYDPTKPQISNKIRQIPNSATALNRYTSQIYDLDKVPYYGPSPPFRPIVNGGDDHFSIKAKMGNLEDRQATQKNINELTKQLNKLNNWIEGPKYMSHDAKGREVYFKDAKAYYDPTLMDKIAQKAKLIDQINNLTIELNDNSKPTLIVGTMKSSLQIQNFVNTNKEETNEFIGNSYYYPVDRKTLAPENQPPKFGMDYKKEAPKAPINLYTRKPENILIGSVNKYYGENNKIKIVEAESTGVKADKQFYYEDNKKANNANAVNVKVGDVQNSKNEVHIPDTQGLKTGGFRIVSLRKRN